jgi:rubrerythrin
MTAFRPALAILMLEGLMPETVRSTRDLLEDGAGFAEATRSERAGSHSGDCGDRRCRTCGYGIAGNRSPRICPMCRGRDWEPSRGRPLRA